MNHSLTTIDRPTTADAAALTMGPLRRVREAVRVAWTTLRTGRHQYADGFMKGLGLGMDSGFAAALGNYNARLVAQGIDPIRSPR